VPSNIDKLKQKYSSNTVGTVGLQRARSSHQSHETIAPPILKPFGLSTAVNSAMAIRQPIVTSKKETGFKTANLTKRSNLSSGGSRQPSISSQGSSLGANIYKAGTNVYQTMNLNTKRPTLHSKTRTSSNSGLAKAVTKIPSNLVNQPMRTTSSQHLATNSLSQRSSISVKNPGLSFLRAKQSLKPNPGASKKKKTIFSVNK